MELILGIISGLLAGFLLGSYFRKPLYMRLMKAVMEDVVEEKQRESMETAGIIHPIPPMVKREQQKTEEARNRGEDGIPLDQI